MTNKRQKQQRKAMIVTIIIMLLIVSFFMFVLAPHSQKRIAMQEKRKFSGIINNCSVKNPRKYSREITFSVGGVRIRKAFDTFSRSELTFNKVISMCETYERVVGIYRVNRKDDYILMSINAVK